MAYGVTYTDIIVFQFENAPGEDFSANELIILYSPAKDEVFMIVNIDPFRAASFVKAEEMQFILQNEQVYAEMGFFRRLMKDNPETMENLNRLEAHVRESAANADMSNLPLFELQVQDEDERHG